MSSTNAKVQKFLAAIQEGKNPDGYFGKTIEQLKDLEDICAGLKVCPFDVNLNLAENNLGPKAVRVIASGLESGSFPENLKIRLDKNSLGHEAIQLIANALQSKKCPKGLSLDFGECQLDVTDIKVLAEAVKSENCPEGFSLGVQFNSLGDEGILPLVKLLQSGQYPRDFTLCIASNNLGPTGIKAISDALELGKCHSKLHIMFGAESLEDKSIQYLMSAIKSGQCPDEFTLSLYNTHLTADAVVYIAQAIQSKGCPNQLKISLGLNQLDDSAIEPIVRALGSGCCHAGLKIDLSENKITEKGFESFLNMFRYESPPTWLRLKLDYNPLGKNIVNNFGLNFGNNSRRRLNDAIRRGFLPIGLNLSVKYSDMDSYDQGNYITDHTLSRIPYGMKLAGGPDPVTNEIIMSNAIQAFFTYLCILHRQRLILPLDVRILLLFKHFIPTKEFWDDKSYILDKEAYTDIKQVYPNHFRAIQFPRSIEPETISLSPRLGKREHQTHVDHSADIAEVPARNNLAAEHFVGDDEEDDMSQIFGKRFK